MRSPLRAAPTGTQRLACAALLSLASALPFAACSQTERDFDDPGATGTSTTSCEPGASAPCYSGPEGTEDVGACAGGTMECNAEGTGYGACIGEVLPAEDACATPEDEDCDGAPKACPLEAVWARGFLSEGFYPFPTVAADAAGNVTVAGSFNVSLDLGNGQVLSAPDADEVDAFVVQLGPDGAHRWSLHLGGLGRQTILALDVDASGNVVVAGSFTDQIDYGTGVQTALGGSDMFVLKLGGDGSLVWGRVFGGATDESATAVAVDPAGQVLVGGSFSGTLSLGGNQLTSAGGADVLVMKLAASGSPVIYARGFGGMGYEYLLGVDADAAGSAIVTGTFGGTIDFGAGLLTTAGQDDIFLAKLDGGGNVAFSQRFGDALDDEGPDVAVSGQGDILLTGYFEGIASFGGDPLPSAGSSFFAASYSPEGAHRWSRAFGSNETDDHFIKAARGATGEVLLAGYFNTEVSFGGDALTTSGPPMQDADPFLAKLDADGAHIASRSFGTPVPEAFFDVAVDGDGASIVAGLSIGGAIDLGTGPLPAADNKVTFLVGKFAP